MLYFGCGEYTIGVTLGELPITYSLLVTHAVLHDDLNPTEKYGTLLASQLGVQRLIGLS